MYFNKVKQKFYTELLVKPTTVKPFLYGILLLSSDS